VTGDGAALEAVFARSREVRAAWRERGAGVGADCARMPGDLAPK
jgi:hypothetical protein